MSTRLPPYVQEHLQNKKSCSPEMYRSSLHPGKQAGGDWALGVAPHLRENVRTSRGQPPAKQHHPGKPQLQPRAGGQTGSSAEQSPGNRELAWEHWGVPPPARKHPHCAYQNRELHAVGQLLAFLAHNLQQKPAASLHLPCRWRRAGKVQLPPGCRVPRHPYPRGSREVPTAGSSTGTPSPVRKEVLLRHQPCTTAPPTCPFPLQPLRPPGEQ